MITTTTTATTTRDIPFLLYIAAIHRGTIFKIIVTIRARIVVGLTIMWV